MKDRTAVLMGVSGAIGFSLFVVANFTSFFHGLDALAGTLQLFANTFVFVSYLRGFKKYTGGKKYFAALGVFIPPIMASITIYRVLIPFFFG